MLKEYLKFCVWGRALSTKTIQNYEVILQLFADFATARGKSLISASEKDISDYVAHCLQNGNKPSTCNVYVTTLKVFYNWAMRFHFDQVRENPCANIPKLKARQDLPLCISSQKMERILSELPENTFRQQRAKLAVLMGYHTGMRRNEMVILLLSDLDMEQKTIRVLGKGGKVRIVPMSGQLVTLLEKYFATRKILGIKSEYLYSRSDGKAVGYGDFAVIVKQTLRQFVPENLSHCHILRHSFATACLNSGVSIENIAALMGHASIETTMRYLTISSERIKQQLAGVF